VVSFDDFSLSPALRRNLERLNFSVPTPIQCDAIPPALEGKDVLACAMTGSGKTAAFGLPLIERLSVEPKKRGPRALILTPTRELAAQVTEHLAHLARGTGLRVAALYGGVSPNGQERDLRAGVEIIVATPGRLLDHLRQPYAKLDAVEVLVLDEADRMLDMGFLPDVRRIIARVPKNRQTLLFSATLPKPIVTLSHEMMRQPVAIDVARPSKPATGLTQYVYPVAQELKSALLVELLARGTVKSAIAFTRTKHRANRLAQFLVANGVSAERIHGNRSQAQRTQALENFKRGRHQVLVATDIAARGIDITALGHVVNFDVPVAPDEYVHRVGRTARAERTGEAITFVAQDEEPLIRAIERNISSPLQRVKLEGFDYTRKPAGKLEVPLAERLAAIRATRRPRRFPARKPGAKPSRA
jgi:ATP-dependent RNA helicase RhlE